MVELCTPDVVPFAARSCVAQVFAALLRLEVLPVAARREVQRVMRLEALMRRWMAMAPLTAEAQLLLRALQVVER